MLVINKERQSYYTGHDSLIILITKFLFWYFHVITISTTTWIWKYQAELTLNWRIRCHSTIRRAYYWQFFFSFNIVESLHHIRRWNNTRCFHLVNYSDENGSIKFWCVLILIISRVKDGSGSHFRAGSSKEWRSVRAHLIQNSIQYSKLCCVYGT